MDCKLILVALVFCLVQLHIEAAGAGAKESCTYCECLEKCKKEENTYETELKNYMKVEVPFKTRLAEDIKQMLTNMKKDPNCINSYIRSNTLCEFENLVAGSCGITWLRNEYNAPWIKDTKMSKEDVCLFITTKGEVAKSLWENNLRRMKNCKGTEWFQETIYKPWENCTLTP